MADIMDGGAELNLSKISRKNLKSNRQPLITLKLR
jgi:hypothetical protein